MTGKQKAVLAGAGALTAVSILQSRNNIALANEILGEYGKVALKEVIGKSAVAAGKAAVIGGLGTYGAIKIGDLAKKSIVSNKRQEPPKNAKVDGPTWRDHDREMKRLEKMGAKIDGPTNFDLAKSKSSQRDEIVNINGQDWKITGGLTNPEIKKRLAQYNKKR